MQCMFTRFISNWSILSTHVILCAVIDCFHFVIVWIAAFDWWARRSWLNVWSSWGWCWRRRRRRISSTEINLAIETSLGGPVLDRLVEPVTWKGASEIIVHDPRIAPVVLQTVVKSFHLRLSLSAAHARCIWGAFCGRRSWRRGWARGWIRSDWTWGLSTNVTWVSWALIVRSKDPVLIFFTEKKSSNWTNYLTTFELLAIEAPVVLSALVVAPHNVSGCRRAAFIRGRGWW